MTKFTFNETSNANLTKNQKAWNKGPSTRPELAYDNFEASCLSWNLYSRGESSLAASLLLTFQLFNFNVSGPTFIFLWAHREMVLMCFAYLELHCVSSTLNCQICFSWIWVIKTVSECRCWSTSQCTFSLIHSFPYPLSCSAFVSLIVYFCLSLPTLLPPLDLDCPAKKKEADKVLMGSVPCFVAVRDWPVACTRITNIPLC